MISPSFTKERTEENTKQFTNEITHKNTFSQTTEFFSLKTQFGKNYIHKNVLSKYEIKTNQFFAYLYI